MSSHILREKVPEERQELNVMGEEQRMRELSPQHGVA